MSDERLRELYAAAASGRPRPESHPAPEALAALARREGPEDARLATLDHVMGCADCRRDLDLLRTVERAGAESGARREASRRAWLVPAALAASLLLAIGISQVLRSSADDATRGEGTTGAVVLVHPAAALPAGAPITFAWRPVAGAGRYELELLDGAGAVTASATTVDTSATPESTGSLPPGEYRWWVRATTSDARVVRSPVRPLRLTAD